MPRIVLGIVLIGGLTGCQEGRYPLSQQECTAEDPIVQSNQIDCAPLPAGSGTF